MHEALAMASDVARESLSRDGVDRVNIHGFSGLAHTEVQALSSMNTISSSLSPASSPPPGHDYRRHSDWLASDIDPANLLIETLPRATLAHEPVHSRSTANDGALG
jgi:hypothetical protein